MGVHFVKLPSSTVPSCSRSRRRWSTSRCGEGCGSSPRSTLHPPQLGTTLTRSAEQPQLAGHLFHYVPGPNRYGPDTFYELHVWAFGHNPSGAFADWNPNVSCAPWAP